MILNSAKISKLRNRPRRSPMPTLADPCTIRYNPVSYYLLPASPRVLSSLSCTPVPPWPTRKYQAWFLEPLVENLKSDIGWTRLGVPYLKWTLKISLQMCHRVRMFRQNVKSSEKEWKQGIFYNKAAELDIRKQLLLSGIEKCVKHKYNSFNTALHQFKRPLISNLGQLQKNMLIWAQLWYRWIITYTTIMILIMVYLNGMERNDQYTTINAKSRETNGVSKCSELPCKCTGCPWWSGSWVGLTQIWDVPPSCFGSR